MTKRKWIVLGSIVALIVVPILIMQILAGMRKMPERRTPPPTKRYVKVKKIEYSDTRSGFRASGRLLSTQSVDLISEVQGKIFQGSVPLKKGQSFRRGTLLAKIYSTEAVLALKAKKSRFLNSISNLLPDFKIDFPNSYETWKKFFEKIELNKKLPNLPKIESGKEKIYLASKNVLNDYFMIKSDESRLTKYNLIAPFNGTFTQVMLEPHAVANPGSKIAKMIRTDQLELEVPIEVENIKWINTGEEVEIICNNKNLKLNGKVVRKAGFVENTTQSISVFIQIKSNNNKALYQGMYLTANFLGTEMENVMKIPRNAVFNKDEVFVVVDGKLQKKKINIIKINEKNLYFRDLKQGEFIVTQPLVGAHEGTLVEMLK